MTDVSSSSRSVSLRYWGTQIRLSAPPMDGAMALVSRTKAKFSTSLAVILPSRLSSSSQSSFKSCKCTTNLLNVFFISGDRTSTWRSTALYTSSACWLPRVVRSSCSLCLAYKYLPNSSSFSGPSSRFSTSMSLILRRLVGIRSTISGFTHWFAPPRLLVTRSIPPVAGFNHLGPSLYISSCRYPILVSIRYFPYAPRWIFDSGVSGDFWCNRSSMNLTLLPADANLCSAPSILFVFHSCAFCFVLSGM